MMYRNAYKAAEPLPVRDWHLTTLLEDVSPAILQLRPLTPTPLLSGALYSSTT